MRKFLISSKKYEGYVEVVYGPLPTSPAGGGAVHDQHVYGVLERIDFTLAELSGPQRKHFKEIIPVLFRDFETCMQGLGAIVVEQDYEVSFEDYWRQVRKKVNRKRAQIVWGKLPKTAQVMAVLNLPNYYKYLERAGRIEADPETYLVKGYYETEWHKL